MGTLVALSISLLWTMIPASPPAMREMSFEQRVEAQEAIERVYYAHQIGATLPFEQAIPRTLIEKKVRDYLKASTALETWWSTEVTAAALQRETERMARDSRLPGRLSELHAALHHDSFLIQECLARPALVNRLARRFFAHDDRIHEEARRQAAELGPVTDEAAKRAWEDWWSEFEGRFDESTVAAVADGTWTVPQPAQAAGCDPQGAWLTGGLEDSPDPSSAVRAVWTGSEVIVWGGSHPARHRYDPATDSWSSISILDAPDRTPAPYSQTSLAWTGTIVLAWGGTPSKSGRYNPFLDAWQPVSAVNAPAGASVSVWTGTQLLVWGGSVASNKRYDPIADVWSNMSTIGQPPFRNIPRLVWTGSEMILWGGYLSLSGLAIYEWPGGRYDPTTDTWSPMSDVGAPPKREQHSAVWTGTRMVIWGGAQLAPDPPGPPPSYPPYYAQVQGGLYDPQTDTWGPVSLVNAPTPRFAHMTVWTGSRMIVWGGRTGEPLLNTGAIYDPAANLWTPISPANAPEARAYSATVWTGNEMILWGGEVSTRPHITATGGRYDPSSDTWTPIGLTGAPQARTNHTVVWTGNEMIVWGGSPVWYLSFGPFLGSGARFDPALGTWSPVTMVGAPSPRMDHTAVWTGSEMVVWGGTENGQSIYLQSGGRYNPITDTWDATRTTNAPSGRSNHSAVWTGSEMLVWGGRGPQNNLFNTGGLYDPARDRWTSTTTSGAPAGRELHAAAWTGSRMIVWGGGSATGGLYDPAADTWSPMATTPLSVSRDHAVWSGTEMLIWEGTGQRYNPVTDSWSPMSSTTNVIGTHHFNMAWSGQEMIVWGGINSSQMRFNTGMRYKPATDSWTLTTTANAPWRRDHASAVWAEDVMLVWGGGDTRPMRSGGAYTVPSAADADGDGSLAWDPNSACEADCDDASPTVFPGASQICGDGLNNDCSHPSWPSLAGTNEGDGDGDGFTACAGDCADVSPTVYPGAPQICDDLNNDCTSPFWPTPPSADADVDQDGFALCEGDCNDTSMTVYPGAPQICDRLNNDCGNPSWPAVPASETDGDHDQSTPCEGDCDDTNATVHTWAPQICGDGLNNDCTHPSWPSLAGTNEVDNDGDGLSSCQADCDDADPASWEAPGEALDLRVSAGGVLSWLPPAVPGGTSLQYDVIRADYDPLAFGPQGPGFCVETDGGDTTSLDTEIPILFGSGTFFYLVRAQNGCGAGPAGLGSSGSEMPAVTCP